MQKALKRQMVRAGVSTCLLAAGSSGAQGGREPIRERCVYKVVGERELSLYIVKPEDWKPGDSRPAAVFFHGGGWTGGGPHQFDEHSKYLASRGMVCVQVEYRLIDKRKHETPEKCIHDARSAMRWVRARASKLGIDPDRIASGGGSAGGHLAAFVGMVDGMDDPADDLNVSPKSNAMLLFNPVFDNGPGGFGYGLVKERYEQFSPFHNVSADDPPALVFFGDQDKLVPVETAMAFKAAMDRVGVRCDVMIFEGMPHGFFNYAKYDHVPYYKTILACDEFLAGLGWLEGPPTLDVDTNTLETISSPPVETSRDRHQEGSGPVDAR